MPNQQNSEDLSTHSQREVLPMDPRLTTIQPGGGVVIRLEQAWGRLRRAYLKTCRPAYVKRMAESRRGDRNPCPHEVLDPRDLKFYQNQPGYYWDRRDDPFEWRNHLPFVRAGLAELLLMGGGSLLAALVLIWLSVKATGTAQAISAVAGAAILVVSSLIFWFFRNPRREIPDAPGLVVSPADGTIVEIEEIPFDEVIGGPAKKIGIFLSIFNVHINRAPIRGRVFGLTYRPGKYLNALRPESARENEQLAVLIESTDVPQRAMIVRQITGAIARRIVCWLKPGDSLSRGEQFGMIKLGSRTELVMPSEDGMEIRVQLGDKVKAGSSILAVYRS